MREIKFRAWNGKKIVDCNDWQVISLNNPNRCGFQSVMQFTGLKDKNGREIYEGDIVRATYEDLLGDERAVVGVVEIENLQIVLDFPNNGITVAMIHFWTDEPDDFGVIGNVHENPELIGEQK